MKKMNDKSSLETKIARFLMKYRVTPHTTTGQSPSELLMKRTIRSRLDLVRPDLQKRVQEKQFGQAHNHDMHAKEREFQIQDAVFAHNYAARGPKWLPGHVIAQTGPVSYKVKLTDGRVWKRHVDQIRKRYSNMQNPPQAEPKSDVFLPPGDVLLDEAEVVNEQPDGNQGNQPNVGNEQG
ncbi:uncharacterized protein [Amphiura filiformis]|uniref:uncharacterized protein n=1 Tax=Amphiura filiformis TaxID=82378 RepID=UPI003B21B98B